MQAVWGTADAPEIDETVAPKRQRLFIARQACEICRQKKTRCDGGNPCGLCRTGGLECRYAERKATKNEVSLGMIFNTLQRIEAKIEEGQQQQQRQRNEGDSDDDEGDEESTRRQSKRKRSHGGNGGNGISGGSGGIVQTPLADTTTPAASSLPPTLPQAQPAVFASRERRYSVTATSSPTFDLGSPSTGSTLSRDGLAHSGINALLSAASPLYQQHLHTQVQQQQQQQQQQPHQHHHHHQYSTPPRPRHVPVIQYPIRQLANWPAIRELLHKCGARGSGSPRGGVMSHAHNNNSSSSSGGGGGASMDAASYIYDAAAATVLEQRRPPLPFPPLAGVGGASGSDGNWLAQLNVSVVKDLGDVFFATFNLGNPILDRRLFGQHSLGVAIGTGFGVNMESCIVLVTMALGVLGKKALREAGITGSGGSGGGGGGGSGNGGSGGGSFRGSMASATPFDRRNSAAADLHGGGGDEAWDDGLVFFNEARKRVGMLSSDSSLQACQYHLLCSLFYSQLLRPFDWWSHVTRAVACCTSFWACIPKDCDEWTMDMQARLFWITAMFEAVLTQELDFPVSNLLNYEDRVPLPKFVAFPGMASFSFASPSMGMGGESGIYGSSSSSSTTLAAQEEEQDSFCHYHFLSQIAHRIILSRLCDSLFANRGKALASGQTIEAASQATTMARSDYPPQALEDELLHQLEQWRSQLPGYLQWDDDNAHRYADARPAFDAAVPLTPANVFVVPWLQARYCIARYHLRRPLLHRALHHPDWMTPADFDKCRDALACAVRWCSVIRPTLEVVDCLYLKYFLCTQLFGMLLLFHALEQSSVAALRQLVPPTYEAWRAFAFGYLERNASSSPSVAREYEIVSVLRDRPVPLVAAQPLSEDTESIALAMEALQQQQQQQQQQTPHDTTPSSFKHVDGPDDERRLTRSSRQASLHEL